jgi:hypothetical protein
MKNITRTVMIGYLATAADLLVLLLLTGGIYLAGGWGDPKAVVSFVCTFCALRIVILLTQACAEYREQR